MCSLSSSSSSSAISASSIISSLSSPTFASSSGSASSLHKGSITGLGPHIWAFYRRSFCASDLWLPVEWAQLTPVPHIHFSASAAENRMGFLVFYTLEWHWWQQSLDLRTCWSQQRHHWLWIRIWQDWMRKMLLFEVINLFCRVSSIGEGTSSYDLSASESIFNYFCTYYFS